MINSVKTNLTTLKLTAILALVPFSNIQTACQPSWIERNINGVMMGSLLAQNALQFAVMNYGVGGQILEDNDAFKTMVKEEFASMGITDHQSYYVKISAHPAIEQSLMMTLPGGIVIADSLYRAFAQPESDKASIRFLVRHEAAHFKNGDVYKRVLFNVALFATLLYGADYLINKADQKGYLPQLLQSFNAKCCLKALATMLTTPITNYFCTYNQEFNADKKAATTADIAAGGSRAMGRLAEMNKKMGSLEGWFQSKPALYRMLTGYQTFADRSKMLAETADQLKEKLPVLDPVAIKKKAELISAIIYKCFSPDYYQAVFQSINKSTGIDVLTSDKYGIEMDQYKKNLVDQMALYLDANFSVEELDQMLEDGNAPGWHKILMPQCNEIIEEQTRQFCSVVHKK